MESAATPSYRTAPHRTSMYAGDMILFLSPVAGNLQLTKCILTMFEKASGLGCNMG
jgi:hypothetical protein